MLGQFHLTGSVWQAVKDVDNDGPEIVPFEGWSAVLTSNYPLNAPLPDGDDVTYIDQRTVGLLDDGQISEDGVNPGVYLTAHDDALFDSALQWTIKPGPVMLGSGKKIQPRAWTFNAPLDTESATLGELTPVAAESMTSLARGPAGPGVDDAQLSGNSVQFYSQGQPVGDPFDLAVLLDAVVDGAPGALDTLYELAAALDNDANFASTVTNAIAAKQPLDADLTELSGVATQAFGRSLLTTTDAASARTAIRAADESAAGAMRNLMTKLTAGVSDAVIVINSDSTANETTEWAYLTTQWLATQYPAYTVNYYLWDTGGNAWPGSPTVVQTGSGSYTLTVWNAAVAGSTTAYFKGSRFSNLVKNADLIMVNHGFNQGGPTNTDNLRQTQRNVYLSLVDELAQVNPHAGVVLMGQPPTAVAGRENWQAERNLLYAQAATWRGWGFIDVHKAWIEYGDWEADLTAVDGTHPTTAGSVLWASLVEAALENAARIPVTTQPAQAVRPSRQIFKNPQLSAWPSTLPDGVTSVTNCTVSKEVSDYETGTQAMLITSDATSGGAYVEITGTADAWGIKGRLADRAYTMAVRIKAPTANAQTVRISLLDNNGGGGIHNSDMGATARDRYMWMYVTKLFPSNATTLTARIYVKTSSTDICTCTVDEVLVFPGVVPHTGADRDTLGALSTADGDFVRRVGSAYVGNTVAEVKTALALVKGDVGLGSVDNTSDTAKPVSTAQQTALNLKADLASPTFTGTPTLPTPIINGTPTGTGVATAATASTLALRDANANLTADNFIATRTSTATAAGTTTLTIDSAQVQEFTGSTTQTVLLPTTSVVAGQTWTVLNNSSGTVTVQSSGANAVVSLTAGRMGVFTAAVDTPTTAAHWFPMVPATNGATASSVAQRDGFSNLYSDCFISTATSTATAAGTTTLTIGSSAVQVFTGSTTQTCVLPTTLIAAGQQFTIINNSSGTVTVNSSGGNLVATLLAGESKICYALAATPTTAAHWRAI